MHDSPFSLPITDPVLIFALVLLLILLLPLLFQRIRMPGLVGLILAGVAVGPHALNLLARDETMILLGTVGILYIMFIAGIEVDLNEFARSRNRSSLFGFIAYSLGQAIGTLGGHYVLGFDWVTSVLLGAVLSSHTLLAYPIISRLGLAKTEPVTISVGATILTDTAALLVLAVVMRLFAGDLDAAFWIRLVILLSIYVVAVLWGLPRLGRWFYRKVRNDGTSEFIFLLAALFIAAFLAELVGIEPIVGAFLAGLALNRLVPEHSTLMNRTRFVGESLFIPFFLISVGMLVDVRVLAGGARAWAVAGVMLATSLFTRWLAAALTRPLFGYSRDESWVVFGLTLPQAAATLAIVLVGFEVGIFDEHVLNGAIVLILVTCLLGPWVGERYGRRVALKAAQTPFEPVSFSQRILVPLANPQTAPQLMELAMMTRSQNSEQPIYPLAIVRSSDDSRGGVAAGEKLLSHAITHAAAADVPVTPLVRIDHNVARGIVRAIQESMISTVIIGWNGKGGGGTQTFGSILDQLLLDTDELVLVTRLVHPLATSDRLVVLLPPYADRDPGFAEFARVTKVLAGQIGARLLVLTTTDSHAGSEAALESTQPVVATEFETHATWPAVVAAAEAQIGENDVLMLGSARQGTLAWNPTLNRLPRRLANRHAETNLIVCYPPVEDPAHAVDFSTSSLIASPDDAAFMLSRGGLIAPGGIRVNRDATTHAQLLDGLLADCLADHPAALAYARSQLTDRTVVPALMPGVLFYHMHLAGLAGGPKLLVGVSPDGVTGTDAAAAGGADKFHVMVVLLSPTDEPPDMHLRTLAHVARMLSRDEVLAAMRTATTADEVAAALTRNN